MARGFNTTLGTNTNDIIATSTFTNSVQRSHWAWAYIRAQVNAAVIWRQNDGNTAHLNQLVFQSAALGYGYYRSWSGSTGGFASWVGGAANVGTGVWHSIGVSYNGSSTTNAPILYADNNKITMTVGNAAVGALNDLSGVPFDIGNDNTLVSCWDGKLFDVASWDTILTDGEFAALASGARPYTIRPLSMSGYWPLDGLSSPEPDLSGNVRNGTVTGAKIQSGPPATLFTPKIPTRFDIPAITTSVLAMHQINAHFTRRITTVGY